MILLYLILIFFFVFWFFGCSSKNIYDVQLNPNAQAKNNSKPNKNILIHFLIHLILQKKKKEKLLAFAEWNFCNKKIKYKIGNFLRRDIFENGDDVRNGTLRYYSNPLTLI